MSQTRDTVDTWDMVVVHRAFRREFGRTPGLIRGVADGDRNRNRWRPSTRRSPR